jgi:hypothetical protein
LVFLYAAIFSSYVGVPVPLLTLPKEPCNPEHRGSHAPSSCGWFGFMANTRNVGT